MKALTIWQPWADLAVRGIKHYETRSRPIRYRGKIAIHAAQFHALPHEVYAEIAEAIGVQDYEKSWLRAAEQGSPVIPFGAIVGTAYLTDCFKTESIRDRLTARELALGDYSDGRYAWCLSAPVLYEQPIPARGKQGLWEYTDS